MSNVTELVDRYFAALNEKDSGKRRELVSRSFTDDANYVDPQRCCDGHEGMNT